MNKIILAIFITIFLASCADPNEYHQMSVSHNMIVLDKRILQTGIDSYPELQIYREGELTWYDCSDEIYNKFNRLDTIKGFFLETQNYYKDTLK